MFTESKKIHLIEEMLKVTDSETLREIESVLNKSKKTKKNKQSAHDFVGLWSKKDAQTIEKAIEEGCEQVSLFKDCKTAATCAILHIYV